MVTTGYAVVLCGWLIYLAVQVIRQRRKLSMVVWMP